MKKFFSILLAIAAVLCLCFAFGACTRIGDEISVSLYKSEEWENITVTEINSADEKTAEYDVYLDYGTTVPQVVLYVSHTTAVPEFLHEKTASDAGYEVEGSLPTVPTVGSYTVKYLYAGYTVKVNYVVSPMKVPYPFFEMQDYAWTGTEITPEIQNNSEYIVYDGDYGETEIGEYKMTISLKDKDNCVWNAMAADNNYLTDDVVIEWRIVTRRIDVNPESLLMGGVTVKEDSVFQKEYSYVYDGDEHPFPINEDVFAELSDDVELFIMRGSEIVTEVRDEGYYLLYAVAKDKEHCQVYLEDTNNGYDAGVVVATIRITAED